MHVVADVALLTDERRTRVDADANTDPSLGCQSDREVRSRGQGTWRGREREEEGVTLCVDLNTSVGCACLPDHAPVVGQSCGVCLRAELVPQRGGALDVGEEERHRAGRELRPLPGFIRGAARSARVGVGDVDKAVHERFGAWHYARPVVLVVRVARIEQVVVADPVALRRAALDRTDRELAHLARVREVGSGGQIVEGELLDTRDGPVELRGRVEHLAERNEDPIAGVHRGDLPAVRLGNAAQDIRSLGAGADPVLELHDRRARASGEDEDDAAAALEVDVEERHQRLVRPGLLGLRVDLVDEADRRSSGGRLRETLPEAGLGELGEVELDVGDVGQRGYDLLDEVGLARPRRRPEQVVVAAFGGLCTRLRDPQPSVLQPLAHVLPEAHVRADDRVLVHVHAREAPDEGDELVRRALYQRHADRLSTSIGRCYACRLDAGSGDSHG